jgi:hypothetical protein
MTLSTGIVFSSPRSACHGRSSADFLEIEMNGARLSTSVLLSEGYTHFQEWDSDANSGVLPGARH